MQGMLTRGMGHNCMLTATTTECSSPPTPAPTAVTAFLPSELGGGPEGSLPASNSACMGVSAHGHTTAAENSENADWLFVVRCLHPAVAREGAQLVTRAGPDLWWWQWQGSQHVGVADTGTLYDSGEGRVGWRTNWLLPVKQRFSCTLVMMPLKSVVESQAACAVSRPATANQHQERSRLLQTKVSLLLLALTVVLDAIGHNDGSIWRLLHQAIKCQGRTSRQPECMNTTT
ncbi:hypothetical protein HaLaN_19086 [Haematococcus lacustris]|uniref:Uncharacterized protein n=1 Tax=Haematococcus lacustris TaxID=44745 RepID=A0A699ZSK1_HAELA|nr:hypothetical protein HaLaN_19086 [Haematococcus lacustris]